MADPLEITMTLDGEPVTFRLGDMTAVDAGDFRRQVGIALMDACAQRSFDLDIVAGLMWLAKRRNQPSLSYQSVAATLTYDSLETIVSDTNGDGEVTGDPEV